MTSTRTFTGRSIILYLALLVILTAAIDTILIRAEKMDVFHGFLIHAEMWVPGLAAIGACALGGVPLVALGWRWPERRWMALGYSLPIFYALIAYLTLWSTGLAPFDASAFVAQSAGLRSGAVGGAAIAAVLTLTYGVIQSAASAMGEEIGWRGFLVPALAERMSFWTMALLSGLVWAAWHMPAILMSDYHGAAPAGVTIGSFTVMIVASGAIYAWLRLKSQSLWPAALAHAAHNAAIQWMFDPMTVEDGRAAWFAGEFGMVLAIVCVIFAAVLILRDPPKIAP